MRFLQILLALKSFAPNPSYCLWTSAPARMELSSSAWLPAFVVFLTALLSFTVAWVLSQLLLRRPLIRGSASRHSANSELRDRSQSEPEIRIAEHTEELRKRNEGLSAELAQLRSAQERLQQNEEHLILLQRFPELESWEWNASPAVALWSEGQFQFFSPEVRKLDWQVFFSAVHPEDRDSVQAAFRQAFRTGGTLDVEYRVKPANRGIRWVWSKGCTICNSAGEPQRMAGLTLDITERKETEFERKRFVAFTERSNDFIAIANPEFRIEFLNQAGRRLIGFDGSEEISAIKLTDCFVPEDQFAVEHVIFPAVMALGSWAGELAFRHFKTGRTVAVISEIFRIDNPDGGGLMSIGTISRDITGRKQERESSRSVQVQLAHTARVTTIEELAASIAHEVNQPLTAIVNNANAGRRMLESTSPDLAELRLTILDIAEAGTRAGRVMERMRTLFTGAPTEKQLVNLNQVIQEVIALMSGEIEKYRVSLQTELMSGLPLVLGDRVQLQQVLLNLMTNGIDAMRSVTARDRRLWIQSQLAEGGSVTVVVNDSGAGIAKDHADKIFDSFFTTKTGGVGMGLPISRSIIEAHGGRLWAAGNDTSGATFRFTLPSLSGKPL
jgi:PAS domain S-box-containing protein